MKLVYQAEKILTVITLRELIDARIGWNPLSRLDPKEIRILADSLLKEDLMDPPKVVHDTELNKFILADAHRRSAALYLVFLESTAAKLGYPIDRDDPNNYPDVVKEEALDTPIEVLQYLDKDYLTVYNVVNDKTTTKTQTAKHYLESFVQSGFDWSVLTHPITFRRSCAQIDARPNSISGRLPKITVRSYPPVGEDLSSEAKAFFQHIVRNGNTVSYINECYKWQSSVTPGKIGTQIRGVSLEMFYSAVRTTCSWEDLKKSYKNNLPCNQKQFDDDVRDMFADYAGKPEYDRL